MNVAVIPNYSILELNGALKILETRVKGSWLVSLLCHFLSIWSHRGHSIISEIELRMAILKASWGNFERSCILMSCNSKVWTWDSQPWSMLDRWNQMSSEATESHLHFTIGCRLKLNFEKHSIEALTNSNLKKEPRGHQFPSFRTVELKGQQC